MFLSPPWGGPEYNAKSFDIDKDIGDLGVNYLQLMHIANSALHHRLTEFAPTESQPMDHISSTTVASAEEQSSEGQKATGSNEIPSEPTAESSGRHKAPQGTDQAGSGDLIPPENLSNQPAMGRMSDPSAAQNKLSALSDQRLLEMANQTLAALDGLDNGLQSLTSVPAAESARQRSNAAVESGLKNFEAPSQMVIRGEKFEPRNGLSEQDAAHASEAQTPDEVNGAFGRAQAPCSSQTQSLSKMPHKHIKGLHSRGIACFLPRSTNIGQLSAAVAEGKSCEVERNILNGRLKSVTVYHGACAHC